MNCRHVAWSEGDLGECAQLFVDVFSARPWSEPWTVDAAKERLREIRCTPGSMGVVCRSEKVVAFAAGYAETSHSGRVFYLKEMCVRQGVQCRGIGGELMRFLHAELKKEDIAHIYLLTRVESGAAAFYASCDYRASGRTQLMSKNI